MNLFQGIYVCVCVCAIYGAYADLSYHWLVYESDLIMMINTHTARVCKKHPANPIIIRDYPTLEGQVTYP